MRKAKQGHYWCEASSQDPIRAVASSNDDSDGDGYIPGLYLTNSVSCEILDDRGYDVYQRLNLLHPRSTYSKYTY